MLPIIPNNNDDKNILHFSLEGLIEPEQTLALDSRRGIIAILACIQERARMQRTTQLSPSELGLFIPLLDYYPYFCPHEVLLAALSGQPDEKTIERARQRLQEALDEGLWEIEVRPVRNALSRIRLKIRNALDLDIISIIETGYMLAKPRRRG